MFGLSFGELLVVVVVILVVFGPRRFANLGRDLRLTFENFRNGGQAPRESGRTPPKRRRKGRARELEVAQRLWGWSNAVGWACAIAGFGLIVADLYWLQTGMPLLALGSALLFIAFWLIWF